MHLIPTNDSIKCRLNWNVKSMAAIEIRFRRKWRIEIANIALLEVEFFLQKQHANFCLMASVILRIGFRIIFVSCKEMAEWICKV